MPDNRQTLINEFAEKIRDAGADAVSIIARWPDKETKTVILIMGDKNLDPWKKQRTHSTERKNRRGE
jgi:hypothetical protein